jgi:hypothetical protein
MKLSTEIRREIRAYRADDQEVQAVCMNLATMIKLKADDRSFTALSDNIKILDVPIHILNDIPTGEFVISSRSRKGFFIGWDRSGLWTSASTNWSAQPSTATGTIFFGHSKAIKLQGTFQASSTWNSTITFDEIEPDPVVTLASRGQTKAQAGLEREKKNWRHQNKRAK